MKMYEKVEVRLLAFLTSWVLL